MLFSDYDPLKGKTFQILDQNGVVVNKDLEPKISNKDLIEMYSQMVLGSIADIKAVQFQRQGRMLTFAPNRGQEAAQVGPMSAVKKTDWLVPSFREFNAMLTHGVTLEQAYLYWYGNERGSRFDDDVNVLPINITIGAQINHAAGIAYATKLQKKKDVVVTFIGDGGTSHGEFHEGVNFAGVFDLPVIVVIQNNHWAISTPRAKATKAPTLAQKAIAYGIPGIQVDGNDILAMYAATTEAAKRARNGEGPTLIEAVTYRLGSHTTSDDPSIYRSNEELEEWKLKDPLIRFKKYLIDKKIWTEAKDEKLHEEANQFVLDTFKLVEKSTITLDEVFDYTYELRTPLLEEQYNELKEYFEGEGK